MNTRSTRPDPKPLVKNLGDLLNTQGLHLPVKTVFLHVGFHTDEAVAWWLAQSESFADEVQKIFPGINQATCLFWDWGQTLMPDEMADTISFGCRGGRADEHSLSREEYANTCAADLFARICELKNDLALVKILATVIHEDRYGKLRDDSIHKVLQNIHRMSEDSRPSIMEILHWCAVAYQAQYDCYSADETLREENLPLTIKNAREYIARMQGEDAAEAWMDLPRRAERNAGDRLSRMMEKLNADRELGSQSQYWFTVDCIVKGKKEKVPMVVMETDSLEINKAALSLGAAIVIIKNSRGNHMIFTRRQLGIDLSTVTMALRTEELRLIWEAGDVDKMPRFSNDQLAKRGDLNGWPSLTPYWFLHDVPHPAANQLYNGSESAPNVPSSRMPLKQIVQIVTTILGGKFHPDFYKKCLKGECAGDRCPWFALKLGRCENVQVREPRERKPEAPKVRTWHAHEN